jgi:A/G-specific adenine glycosylase
MGGRSEVLLGWYRQHRRDLPWRGDRSPYEILVSEIMLQQTRVETVLRYYEPFLRHFPDLLSLAAADLADVLAAWTGLGYYRRARNLHSAALRICEMGQFPRGSAELLELPGIGVYTAAAVASIAFGEAVAVVDGNVERLASRLIALESSPRRAPGRQRVRRVATELLEESAPGDSNQAMMELGAMICTPTSPSCDRCPFDGDCAARATGRPAAFPPPSPRRREVKVRRLVALACSGDRYLLARNPDDSELLAGLWEFPWVEGGRSLADKTSLLGRRYGGRWKLGPVLGRARHGITFRSIHLEIRQATIEESGGEIAEGPTVGWFSSEDARRLPATAMLAKVLRAAARGVGG